MSVTTVNGNGRKSIENRLLYDLEEYVEAMHPDFTLVGEGDIERISSIIGQSENSNLIYVGRTGMGKSANLFGIAQRKKDTIEGTLAEGENRLPLHMIDRRYLLLDTNTLFEKNDAEKIQEDIKRIFVELDKPGNHVLIIEDANDWLRGIEDNQCQGLISSFVRELKKGTFQSILMVKEEPGKNNLGAVIGCHSEMSELFTVLEKHAPGQAEVLDIMRKSKDALQAHHDGLHITDEANEEIVKLTFQYPNLRIYMREQPARALRMRDRIASTYVSRMQARPPELDKMESDLEKIAAGLKDDPENPDMLGEKMRLDHEIEDVKTVWEARALELGKAYMEKRKLEKDIQQLEADHAKATDSLKEKIKGELQKEPTDKDMAAHKTPEIKEIERYLRVARTELEQADIRAHQIKGEHNQKLTLGLSDVRDFFSEISGIPVKDLRADEATKVLGLGDRLKQKIYGQDDVVDSVSGAIRRAKAGLKDQQKPIGSFMMLGSSGVGKTFTAECLAEDLYDDQEALTVFDMSEFMEKHSVSRLIGAPPGYAGYGEGGALTNAVRARPYQVILFDEIEKAHPDVFKIMLQVLDKGRLSDELGTVDFRNTVILMTTNLGQHLSFDDWRTSRNSRADIISEVRKIFPQELVNRVDDFMLFKALQSTHVENILEREIKSLNKRLKDKGITIELPTADMTAIVNDKYLQEEGARQVLKFLNNNMTDQVAEIVLTHSAEKSGGIIRARYAPEKDNFTLSFDTKAAESNTPEIKAMVGGGAPMAGHAGVQARAAFAAAFAPSIH